MAYVVSYTVHQHAFRMRCMAGNVKECVSICVLVKVHDALKEVGDFENYLNVLESQTDKVVTKLEALVPLAAQQQQEGRQEQQQQQL